jgi:hypothetical protein
MVTKEQSDTNCRELTLDRVNGKWTILRNGVKVEDFPDVTAAIERYNQLKGRGKYAIKGS